MTTAYAALGYRFTVTCTDPRLQAHVEQVLSGLGIQDDRRAVRDRGEGSFTIDTRDPAGPFELRLDGEVLASSASPAGPLAHLLHQINLRAVEWSSHLTLLHASAACAPFGPVLFPAAMESGKSTLVTALVLRGWPYVTDEIVALQRSGDVVPYPRAISLDPGSWQVFPDLRPDVAPVLAPLLPLQWQVSVPSVGGHVAEHPGRPAAVVFPSYLPDAPTQFAPITAMEGLRHLLEATFRLERHPRRDMQVLAAVVNEAPCYRLCVGELWEACGLLESEFGVLETRATGRVTVSPGGGDDEDGGRRTGSVGAPPHAVLGAAPVPHV